MTRWTRGACLRRALIGAVMACTLLAAGCGDDTDDADGVAETTLTETSPTTAEDATTSTSTTGSTTGGPAAATVEVAFATGDGSDCSQVDTFTREITDDVDPIEAAFEELVNGPTAEEVGDGASSFFSPATRDAVTSVVLSDGLLVIDLSDLRSVIPNASTSCGSESLLAQLNGTAFQFATVDRVRYRIEGSCDDFANWLQRDCFDTDRSGRQLDVATNERASGSGCTPPTGNGLPDGRWFGFVDAPQADELSFDLACWFSGTAAVAAADEDGEESPPPNDYHIRNQSDLLRTLPVDPSTEVAWLPDPGDPESYEVVTYAFWRDEQSDRGFAPGIWVNIEDGQVISIEEQYVP